MISWQSFWFHCLLQCSWVLLVPHYVQVWRRSVWTTWYLRPSFPNPWCNTTSVCFSNIAVSSCLDRVERVRVTSLPDWLSTWWTAAPAKSQTASWSLSTCIASHARWQKLMSHKTLYNSGLLGLSCCQLCFITSCRCFSLFLFLSPGSAALSFQLGQSNRSGNQHIRNTTGSYSGWYSWPCFDQWTCQWCSHLQISQMVISTYTLTLKSSKSIYMIVYYYYFWTVWNCSSL